MTTITTEERLGRLEVGQAETNRRLDDTNSRITETNARITESNSRLSETNSRLDKLMFMLFGIGAGVIATLGTAIFALITGD